MEKLTDLPNIGKNLEEALIAAEISTPEELRGIGAKQAFFRLKTRDPSVCLSRLCALQGAIDGVRWHNLPDETKVELKAFFKELK